MTHFINAHLNGSRPVNQRNYQFTQFLKAFSFRYELVVLFRSSAYSTGNTLAVMTLGEFTILKLILPFIRLRKDINDGTKIYVKIYTRRAGKKGLCENYAYLFWGFTRVIAEQKQGQADEH